MAQVQSNNIFISVQPVQERTKDSDKYRGDRNRKTVESPARAAPHFLDEKRERRRKEEGGKSNSKLCSKEGHSVELGKHLST